MDVFVEISLIIVIATAFSGVMKLLRQPLIIGYIISGLIVGPYALGILNSTDVIETFSQFGIALLLFIVGLRLSPKVVRDVGRVAILAGTGQILLTSTFGYIIAKFLGFSSIEAMYLAGGLTFSSTIIVLKLLYDKGDLEKLYGKIATGFLLVQDVVAGMVLVLISTTASGANLQGAFSTLFKGIILVTVLYVSYKLLLPLIVGFFAKSQEFLFLFSLAWGMGLASLFLVLGLSMEIGALVAGIILSFFPYSYEISSKMRPLRDFFLVLFFISLGTQLGVVDMRNMLLPAIVFSVFVLVLKPFIVVILMGLLGYNKKVSFSSGVTMAQISEFSLIIVGIGVGVGQIDETILSLATLVGLITITVSTYMIMYMDDIYPKVAWFISLFLRTEQTYRTERTTYYDVVLFGYNRIGFDFLNVFTSAKSKYLVVDYDPSTIQLLAKESIPSLYGDADDVDLLEDLNLKKTKMIVSTIPDFETNESLITKTKHINPQIISICISHDINDSLKLYKLGADYVIMPHFLGGKYASAFVRRLGFSRLKYTEEKKKHIKQLHHRIVLRHEHPKILKNI